MNRRKFIQLGAAGLALSALGNYAAEFADQKKRVGLIGSCANHLQITNSKLNSTATLQSFTDMILSVKMSISY